QGIDDFGDLLLPDERGREREIATATRSRRSAGTRNRVRRLLRAEGHGHVFRAWLWKRHTRMVGAKTVLSAQCALCRGAATGVLDRAPLAGQRRGAQVERTAGSREQRPGTPQEPTAVADMQHREDRGGGKSNAAPVAPPERDRAHAGQGEVGPYNDDAEHPRYGDPGRREHS